MAPLRKRTQPRSIDRGFTLIEVVLAIAILAISLTTLYEIFSETSGRARVTQRKELAWLVAQSLLTEFRSAPQVESGERTGDASSDVHWTVAVKPYGESLGSGLQLYEVAVTVRWGSKSNEGVELRSIEWGHPHA